MDLYAEPLRTSYVRGMLDVGFASVSAGPIIFTHTCRNYIRGTALTTSDCWLGVSNPASIICWFLS